MPSSAADIRSALQTGLFEEEANRNFDAAIRAYQAVMDQHDQERQFVATALFRLGECYRKLGRTNDAVGQYQRVLRDFSDQSALADLSRQTLSALGASPFLPGSQIIAQARQEQRRLLLEEIQMVEKQLKDLQASVDAGRIPRGDLLDRERELLQLRRQLVGFDAGLEPAPGAAKPATAAATSEEEEEIRRIQALIKNSPDLINTPGTNGLTPLQQAAASGYLSVARFLLANGAEVNTSRGASALHIAAVMGNKAMVELLLVHGAEVNAVCHWIKTLGISMAVKGTPLHFAAKQGYLAVAETLLAHKADVNLSPDGEPTPLGLAAEAGRKDMVELLLQHGAAVNVQTQSGWTPLHYAAEGGNPAAVELLLAHQAPADAKAKDGATPLTVAVAGGHIKIAEHLLAKGATVDAVDGYGLTPLQQAVTRKDYVGRGGQPELVRLLLKAGADANRVFDMSRGDRGIAGPIRKTMGLARNTPLTVAAFIGDTEVVEALLAHGASVNVKSTEGTTPLHYAIEWKSLPMVDAILVRSPDLEMRDQHGNTALASAVNSDQTKTIAERLIQAGANVNAELPSRNASTPLHGAVLLASVSESPQMVELLLKHQANPNVLNRDGETPLEMAKRNLAGTQTKRASLETAATLLLAHGADPQFTRRSHISLARPERDWTRRWFLRGTNDWNRYSLGELVDTFFSHLNADDAQKLAFPDLSRITIRRLAPQGGPDQEIKVDLLAWLQSADCANDPWLEWGDIVEIPERDHPVQEYWSGLPAEVAQALEQCLAREVSLIIKGEKKTLPLKLPLLHAAPPGVTPAPRAVTFPTRAIRPGVRPGSAAPVSNVPELPAAQMVFRLNEVLEQSGLLRISSDRSGVQVRRMDSATGQPMVRTFDLSKDEPYDASSDLWLRDGDLIAVPEKGSEEDPFQEIAPQQGTAADSASVKPTAGDRWQKRADAPLAGRHGNTSIWTGREMIVFGGEGLKVAFGDGARYDPAKDTWTQLPPEPHRMNRSYHSAVWTGEEMIVWGGFGCPVGQRTGAVAHHTGARFNSATGQWKTLSTDGAPYARFDHTATWTGSEMIVWGGYTDLGSTYEGGAGKEFHRKDGARYDPASDTWKPMSTLNAPSPRTVRASVWTGTHFVVWGGLDATGVLNDGAMYDPVSDQWQPLPAQGAPSARGFPHIFWTGEEVLVMGGYSRDMQTGFTDGAAFNPQTGQWRPLKGGFEHCTAVWTGTELIAWGGQAGMKFGNEGVRYHPKTDVCTPMTRVGAPAPRTQFGRAAVWTGDSLLIFGGWNGTQYFNDSYRYTP